MTDLLTRGEYRAVARSLNFPANAFVNGKFTAARGGKTFATRNPATGEILAKVAACGKPDADFAVRKARETFESGAWSRAHPAERKSVLVQLAKLLRRNRRELAVMESLDSGKPIRECETVDLPETINCILWHAESADKIYGQVAPTGDDALAIIVREPVGVAACVLPWNFPLMTLAWKIGPALAAGNSVVAKPAEQTPLTALRLAELAMEAGLPAGVLNIVPGLGETAGCAIGLHPDIDAVSFTGSTEIGRKFLEYSAQSNLKRVTLECGGKSPCVVLDDADRLGEAAAHIATAAFWNMGENCTANSRLIVDRKIAPELLPMVMEKIRDWRVGDPLDPASALGAMISPEHADGVMRRIRRAEKDGAKILTGGKLTRPNKNAGGFIPPTVLTGVSPDMEIAREEIFGPVLTVIEAGGMAEALRIANDTCYGLQASVFTANARRAHLAARELRAGTVSVNCYGEGDLTTPFGGYKLSGFGGRDKSMLASEQYTEVKTVWLNLSDSQMEEEGESAKPSPARLARQKSKLRKKPAGKPARKAIRKK